MLVETGPVKGRETMRITREMGRNPVEDDADPLFMHIVHKRLKIVRSPETTRRRIVTGHLIAPGLIERVLHHREKLHMGVAHLLDVSSKFFRDLPVIIKLAAVDVIPIFILSYRFLHPGAEMDLIDRHRRVLQPVFCRFSLFDPLAIVPLIISHIPDHGRRIRSEL